MISKIVNITFSECHSTYKLGIGHGDLDGGLMTTTEEFYSKRACRMFPPEIDFIEKAVRDYRRAQEILEKAYTNWNKCS